MDAMGNMLTWNVAGFWNGRSSLVKDGKNMLQNNFQLTSG